MRKTFTKKYYISLDRIAKREFKTFKITRPDFSMRTQLRADILFYSCQLDVKFHPLSIIHVRFLILPEHACANLWFLLQGTRASNPFQIALVWQKVGGVHCSRRGCRWRIPSPWRTRSGCSVGDGCSPACALLGKTPSRQTGRKPPSVGGTQFGYLVKMLVLLPKNCFKNSMNSKL